MDPGSSLLFFFLTFTRTQSLLPARHWPVVYIVPARHGMFPSADLPYIALQTLRCTCATHHVPSVIVLYS